MAATAIMVSTPSSLMGGEPASKIRTPASVSNAGCGEEDRGIGNTDTEEYQHQAKHESRSRTDKPIEFSDSSKKPPRMSSVDDYTMLPEGYVPKDEDVICSWARQNHSHPGNEKFRIVIKDYAQTYLNVSTKYQKSEVIAKIVAEVRSKSPGGGFVKKDFYSNRWFEVGDEKARDKVGHAIRKAAVGLGKKLNGNKHQPQSLAKRRLKNKNDFDQLNTLNMNMTKNEFLNKAALMNGMNLDNGFAGISNDMNLSSMNMNMNALTNLPGRNALMGVSNMRGAPGLMGAMGVNGVGMGMNSIGPMSYSRELEEMLVMNRLRSEVAPTGADTALLGTLYGNGKASNESGGLSGLNMMAGMDDSAMLEELQRRRVRLDAAAKKEEAMNMLRESDQMTRWAGQNNNTNKSSLNDVSMDFNNNPSGLNGMNGGNRSNFMAMNAIAGAPGNLDNINANNLDSMATSTFLSKLASGNAKMSDQLLLQGASNFGNNNGMINPLMNLNNNLGSNNDGMGDLPISNNGFGSQSLNQIREQFNYDMP